MTNSLMSASDYAYSIVPSNNTLGLRPKTSKKDARINDLYRALKQAKNDCLSKLPDAMEKGAYKFVVDTVLDGFRKGLPFKSGCSSFIGFIDMADLNHLSAKYGKYLRQTPEEKRSQENESTYHSSMIEFEKAYKKLSFYVFDQLTKDERAQLDIEGLKAMIQKEQRDPQFQRMPIQKRPQFRRYLEIYVKCNEGLNTIPKKIEKKIQVIQVFKFLSDHPEQVISPAEEAQQICIREKYLETIRPKVERHFSFIADHLNAQNVLEEDQKLIQQVLREQKRHSFSRFEMLPYFYHSFSHTVCAVASFLNQQEHSLGEKFFASVKDLIRKEMRNTKKGRNDYRDPKYMGTPNKDAAVVSKFTHSINRAMRVAADDHLVTKDLVRAHTMPFPGAFSWSNIETVEQANGVSKVSDAISVGISQDLFLSFKERGITQQDLEMQVMDLLIDKVSMMNNKDELLHFAIVWIKEFYLSLFSETELLPDWINNYPDQVSEWGEKKQYGPKSARKLNQEEKNYKTALGKLLLTLLENRKAQHHLSVDDVLAHLNSDYVPEIFKKLQTQLKVFSSEKADALVMKAALIQVHQSLIYSFKPQDGHHEILNDY